MFRTVTSTVAISSLLLGTARLTVPTYAAFTSVQDQEIGVQACFIFPKEIEKRRDLTYEWKEDAIVLMQNALTKASEVNVAGLTEKIDGMIEPGEEAAAEAPPAASVDSTTIEGLQAQQESLRAEIAAIQTTIAANEQRIADLEAIILEIQAFQTKLQDILTTDFPKADEKARENLEKIEKTLEFIKGIVELAIEQCNYDPEFFELILAQMEGYKQELTLFIEEFAKGKELAEEQIELLSTKTEEVHAAIEALRQQNANLLAKITELENAIAAIDQQIIVFQEIQKKKDALKEGAAELIQKLIDSKHLTAEQMKYLMDKLAEINVALDNKDLTADISGLEQAIADIEKEMSQLEEIEVQKKGLKEGTSLLIQKITESTTLSEEQKQALLEKLTGLHSAIDHGDLSAGTGEFEKALAEIEKEMKQKEEEAKLEKEKIEKEQLEKEQQEDGADETKPQNPNSKEGIDALMKQISESTTLTEEQKQELLEKLAELDAAISENPSKGTSELEKALSDLEKEMKQKEEEAKGDQEEKEKAEEDKEAPDEGKEEPAEEEKPKDPAKEGEQKPDEEKPVKENEKKQNQQPEEQQPARETSNSITDKLLNSEAVQPRILKTEKPNKNLSIEDTRLDMRREESSVEIKEN